MLHSFDINAAVKRVMGGSAFIGNKFQIISISPASPLTIQLGTDFLEGLRF